MAKTVQPKKVFSSVTESFPVKLINWSTTQPTETEAEKEEEEAEQTKLSQLVSAGPGSGQLHRFSSSSSITIAGIVTQHFTCLYLLSYFVAAAVNEEVHE